MGDLVEHWNKEWWNIDGRSVLFCAIMTSYFRALFEIHFSPPYEFILLMNALAMMCSACNPLLYTLFSKKFRARIARILWFSNGKRLPKRNDFSIVKVTANEPTGRLRLDWHHGDDFTPTHYCSESKLDMRSFKGWNINAKMCHVDASSTCSNWHKLMSNL